MTEPFNTLLADPFYSVQMLRYDRQNYPYWQTENRWANVDAAISALENQQAIKTYDMRIVKQTLESDETGLVFFTDILTVVNENGEWHDLYDPRSSDEEWSDYIRLKKKFGDSDG